MVRLGCVFFSFSGGSTGGLLSSEGEVDKRAGVVLGCDVDMCVGTTDAVGWGVEDIIGGDVGEGSVVGIGVGPKDVEASVAEVSADVRKCVEFTSAVLTIFDDVKVVNSVMDNMVKP